MVYKKGRDLMQYICEKDYDYIMNKYHSQLVPFDSFHRFIRNDAVFSPETGLAAEEIMQKMIAQDKEIENAPHPVRKARAFAMVLENTRISCDARDRFPAVNMIDRPIDNYLIKKWKLEVYEEIIPEALKKIDKINGQGIVSIMPDLDHSVPVWDRVFALGFSGLLQDSEKKRKDKRRKTSLTEEEEAFFEGVKITYEAILAFIGRLGALAEKTTGSERMAKALRNIEKNPPRTFYEALLVDYLYFILSEHIQGLQVRSLGNFDRLFYPFFKNDIQNGITEEEIRTDLAYFFLQFTAIGNYWNQPVYLGGCKEDDETVINDLSYLFLDVYDKMRIYNPKIQIKIAESTPKDFILKALDMIRRGNNCIVFVSDSLIRKALENAGYTKEQARTCDVKGCYEYAAQGAFGTGMNYLSLLKPLEYALHEGRDGVTGVICGLPCKKAEEYESFDAFYAEYKKQLFHILDMIIEVVNSFEDYLGYMNPQSMLSATIVSCLERGKDALEGGALTNNSSLAVGFLADVADSLAMVKKHVFDSQELTLGTLRDILDVNFEGHEKVRRKLLLDPDKYGNNKELPDFFAKDIVESIAQYVKGKKNAKKRGGKWNCGFHVARMSYTYADVTAACPSGRKRGEELSKNISSAMGQNKEGATALILSATKIDATRFCGDASLDAALLPASVRGDDGLEAMYILLDTFIKRGGHAIHLNVFDAETLRDAQKYPDKYRDLQIRVCGWNVLWNNISKKEQDGFIRQAEALI